MITKSPSKRVSHLDLKFLDLKILNINSNECSQTVPLPSIEGFGNKNRKVNKPSTLDISANSQQQYKLSNTKLSNFKSHLDESTHDGTLDHQFQSSIICDQNGDTINTVDVMNYLNVDSKAIYQEFDSRLKPTQSQNIAKKEQEERYRNEIQKIKKEKSLIHGQILKIYSEKATENRKVKDIRNMRIFNQNITQPKERKNPLQEHYEQMSSSLRYKSEDKQLDNMGKFFDKFKKSQQMPLKTLKEELNENRNKKLNEAQKDRILDTDKMKLLVNKKLNKKAAKRINLPSLIGNKYEYFYEDLYREDKRNQRMEQINAIEVEKLQELRKKLVNNNFNTNFEAHLKKYQLRVPEFMKNLR